MFGNSEQQDCYEALQPISDILDKATFTPLHFNNLYCSKVKDNFVGAMYTEVICYNCKIVSVVDTKYRNIYISLNNSIEEDFLQTQTFTRSHFCNICNDTNMHNCHSTFIVMPYIFILVVRRFDACLCMLTTKLKGTAFFKIDYKLNSLIEHHGETITRGHYTATVGTNNNCDDFVIRTTKLAQHISNGYMLFYLQT